jgi:hypothetical protein
MPKYNGHRSRAAWNVALWIGNDEGLYNLALDCLAATRGKFRAVQKAAALFMDRVGATRTPDGYKYTLCSVTEALRGLDE